MKASDFTRLPDYFSNKACLDSLYEISKNNKGDACVLNDGYCANLIAISFDKLKELWYGNKYPNQVRSTDGLYIEEDSKYYLIEFKTGSVSNFDLHRKLYDSIVGLIEHEVLSLEECRNKVQYLIVGKKYQDSPMNEVLQLMEGPIQEPWDYSVSRETLKSWDKDDIRKLTNYLVNKVYKLSLSDFDNFAKLRGWSN